MHLRHKLKTEKGELEPRTMLVQTSPGGPASLNAGGYLYDRPQEIDDIKNDGWSTIVMWTIHFQLDGDFVLNEHKIIDDRRYVGKAIFQRELNEIKQGDSTVQRVELGIGSSLAGSFENIETLVKRDPAKGGGTAPGSILYDTFAALKRELNFDAINFDDETNYDVPSTVALAKMLGDLGFQVTLNPYTRISFWSDVYRQVEATHPGVIDRLMLQHYAGGAGQSLTAWARAFANLAIEGGKWGGSAFSRTSPSEMRRYIQSNQQLLGGAWIWELKDIVHLAPTSNRYATASEEYAAAIVESFPATVAPAATGATGATAALAASAPTAFSSTSRLPQVQIDQIYDQIALYYNSPLPDAQKQIDVLVALLASYGVPAPDYL